MFSAMGTEARLRIMQLLLQAHPEGLVVGEIQQELGISKANLSRHVAVLRSVSVVVRRRMGKQVYFSLAMPEVKKAELIEGIVYMGSPVSAEHGEADGLIHGWLWTYATHTPGVRFFPNTTVILDADNTPQPDACLCLKPVAADGLGSARRNISWERRS